MTLSSSVARTLVSVAYGLDILPEEDPLIEIMEQGTKMVFEASVPGRFLVVCEVSTPSIVVAYSISTRMSFLGSSTFRVGSREPDSTSLVNLHASCRIKPDIYRLELLKIVL